MLEAGSSCCMLEEWKVGVPCQEFVAELGIEMSHSGPWKASFLCSFSLPCCVRVLLPLCQGALRKSRVVPGEESCPWPCHPCMVRLVLVPGEVSLTGLPCNLSRFWHSPLRA